MVRTLYRFLILAAGAPLMGGLGAEPVPASSPPPSAVEEAGVVFVVEGIGGFDVFKTAAQWALPRAGVPHEVRHFAWTHGRGKLLKDLQDIRYLWGKGEELAAQVRRYKEDHPGRPVYLLGKSGGTAVVLAAAEQLPPATLERIILVSSAVAPNYDLRPALRATRCELISFYSPHDRFILRWGTSQFGTADRFYGPAAGLNGFETPTDQNEQDQKLYERLRQIPWKPEMILVGHPGNHTGTSMPGFLGKEVAPWLKP